MDSDLPSYFPPPFAAAAPALPARNWTVVDLFSGVGGMTWGFHSLNRFYSIVAAVDAQRAKPGRGKSAGTTTACNPSYAANFGIRPWSDDLATVDPQKLRERTGLLQGQLDVLIS